MVQNIVDRQADTVVLAGQTVDRATVQGIKTASAKSGVSFQYLVAKAAQESSLNPTAQADGSSAAGLFQFTRATWLDMVKRYGSQYGYSDLSRQILETPSGKLAVTDETAEKRILALRNDPEASALMAAEYARDNSASLESTLGRTPDSADLYLAHFLGANGATALLTAPKGSDATALLPAAAKANPAIFTAPNGHTRTAGEVVALVRSRFDSQLARYADAGSTVSDASPITTAPATPTASAPMPANGLGAGKFDLKAALNGGSQTPAQMMMLDQLLRVIAADPMNPANDDEADKDPIRPLSSGALSGSDWADAMSRRLATAPRVPAARTYQDPAPGPQTLDDNI